MRSTVCVGSNPTLGTMGLCAARTNNSTTQEAL